MPNSARPLTLAQARSRRAQFGRYAGESLGWIERHDPSYLVQLAAWTGLKDPFRSAVVLVVVAMSDRTQEPPMAGNPPSARPKPVSLNAEQLLFLAVLESWPTIPQTYPTSLMVQEACAPHVCDESPLWEGRLIQDAKHIPGVEVQKRYALTITAAGSAALRNAFATCIKHQQVRCQEWAARGQTDAVALGNQLIERLQAWYSEHVQGIGAARLHPGQVDPADLDALAGATDAGVVSAGPADGGGRQGAGPASPPPPRRRDGAAAGGGGGGGG
jgi:hypothetical protein